VAKIAVIHQVALSMTPAESAHLTTLYSSLMLPTAYSLSTEMAARNTDFCLLAARTQLTNAQIQLVVPTNPPYFVCVQPPHSPPTLHSVCHNLTTNSESLLCRPIVSTDRSLMVTAAIVTRERARERGKYTGRTVQSDLVTIRSTPLALTSTLTPCLSATHNTRHVHIS
jgi:hypothetical protein